MIWYCLWWYASADVSPSKLPFGNLLLFTLIYNYHLLPTSSRFSVHTPLWHFVNKPRHTHRPCIRCYSRWVAKQHSPKAERSRTQEKTSWNWLLQDKDTLARLEEKKTSMITIKVKVDPEETDSKLNQASFKFPKSRPSWRTVPKLLNFNWNFTTKYSSFKVKLVPRTLTRG